MYQWYIIDNVSGTSGSNTNLWNILYYQILDMYLV